MAEAMRLLVIAPAAIDGASLREQVEERAGNRPVEVHLVAPAVTESKLKATLGDSDDAVDDAQSRLEASIEGLRSESVAASGVVGDADPMVATEDALRTFPADEILIVTHRGGEAEWFERDLFDRAAERFQPPIAHVELGAGDGTGGMAETEHAGAGVSGDAPAEGELVLSQNLPPFSARDLLGIGVAIVGTLVLVLLAANVADHSNTGVAAARVLIATALILINLAHVVGLLFFNSLRYRGGGRSLFANVSLFGTPIAIVVSALIR